MKKIKFKSNLTAGILSLCFGVGVCLLIPSQISLGFGSSEGITPRTLPYLLGGLCALLGIALILQSLVWKRDTVKELNLSQEGKALAYMGVLVGYGILFSVSFFLASLVLGWATLAFLRCKKPLYYGVVAGMIVFLYLALTQLLHLQLP